MSEKTNLIALGIDCTPKETPLPSQSVEFKASLQIETATGCEPPCPYCGSELWATISTGDYDVFECGTERGIQSVGCAQIQLSKEKARADAWRKMAENAISLLRNTGSPSLRIKEEKKKLIQAFDALKRDEP